MPLEFNGTTVKIPLINPWRETYPDSMVSRDLDRHQLNGAHHGSDCKKDNYYRQL
jgi:hypothetical protein